MNMTVPLILPVYITTQTIVPLIQPFYLTAQSFFNYVLLCIVFSTILCCRSEGRSLLEVLRSWGWRYLLIAFIDVEANYLVIKAYAYTTVTSIQV